MKITALLTLSIASSMSFAGDDVSYIRVDCDSKANVLSIREEVANSPTEVPTERGVQNLRDLTVLKTLKTPAGIQDFRVRKRDFRSDCKLRGATYKVVVAPWKFNAKINGMCGGYEPSAQLSVWRNGQALVKKLVFSGYCNAPDSKFSITEVRLAESDRTAQVSMTDDEGKFDKPLPFNGLVGLARERLARGER